MPTAFFCPTSTTNFLPRAETLQHAVVLILGRSFAVRRHPDASGRKGATDVEWIAGHRDDPCSSGRSVQHTDAVDSHSNI